MFFYDVQRDKTTSIITFVRLQAGVNLRAAINKKPTTSWRKTVLRVNNTFLISDI